MKLRLTHAGHFNCSEHYKTLNTDSVYLKKNRGAEYLNNLQINLLRKSIIYINIKDFFLGGGGCQPPLLPCISSEVKTHCIVKEIAVFRYEIQSVYNLNNTLNSVNCFK